MKSTLAIFLFVLNLMNSNLCSSSLDIEGGLNDLVNQLSANINVSNKASIAVIEFSDLNANITELGKFISEELVTNLYKTGKFEVVERQLLNKILKENKLSLTGIIDESTAKELGRILGVEFICSGTITDLLTDIKLNSRFISTETGKIVNTASVKIEKTEVVKNLMSKSSGSGAISDSESFDDVLNSGQPFLEDFSKYKIGEIPFDWGSTAIIKSSPDGYKAITSAATNQIWVSKNVIFPRDFIFEYFITGDENLHGRYFDQYVILTDSDGRDLKIKVQKAGSSTIYIASLSEKQGERKWDDQATCHVKITKKGTDFNIYLNDVISLSANYSHYGTFSKMQFSLSQRFYITEIKVSPW